MVSSRDRSHSQRRDSVVALSPRRRRLRFSFQFNDVKDPIGFRQPHCFAPVVGGGGYLVAVPLGVNRSFRAFSPRSKVSKETRGQDAKVAAGLPGEAPITP
jgi:hypothetical protein